MSNQKENPLGAILAALIGGGIKASVQDVDKGGEGVSVSSNKPGLDKLLDLMAAPALADRISEIMFKIVPQSVVLGYFFGAKDDDAVFNLYKELGSSDAVLQHVLDLKEFPSDGPFAADNRYFEFDLASFQAALPTICSAFGAFVHNVAGRAVIYSKAPERGESAAEKSADDNTMFPPAEEDE